MLISFDTTMVSSAGCNPPAAALTCILPLCSPIATIARSLPLNIRLQYPLYSSVSVLSPLSSPVSQPAPFTETSTY